MKDVYQIAPSPCEEDCAQADGTEEYRTKALKECTVFKNLIRRKLGNEPEGSKLIVKGFPHDGVEQFSIIYYYEVCYEYDDECEEHMDYFYKIDSDCPDVWDEEAKYELEL